MIKTSLLVTLLVGTVCAVPTAAQTQNQPPKNAPVSFGAVPQMTQAQQENFPPQLLEELAKIRDAALADDYAYQQVKHLTENIGPRPSGSAQAKAAVDYVAEELRKLGLEVQLEDRKSTRLNSSHSQI